MRKSRLSKNQERRIKKNLILSIVGSALIIILLLKFGIPFLVNASLIISGSKTQKTETIEDKTLFVAAPILNNLSSATNSSRLIISGFGEKETIAELFVNNDLKDESRIDKSGGFSFEYFLDEGNNEIKVRIIKKETKSNFSDKAIIVYIKTPPDLEIDTPRDGEEFIGNNKTALISGKTNGSDVFINDFKGIVSGDGLFNYEYSLKDGDNIIAITTIDSAGNKTKKEIKIKYSH